MRLFFGLLLLGLGLVFLGNNLGWWTETDFSRLGQYWPLLLILYGIAVIVRHWKLGWIIILVTFFALSAIVYNSILTPTSFLNLANKDETPTTTPLSAEITKDITKAELKMKTGIIKLKLTGDSPKLVSGTLQSNLVKPSLKVVKSGGIATVTLETQKDWHFWCCNWWKGVNELELALSNQIPWQIDLESGASTLELDLTKLTLDDLQLSTGASSTQLKLGDKLKNGANYNIESGASSILIQIPKLIGVLLNTDSGLSSKNFVGFTQLDSGSYQSNNYEAATIKITLSIEAGVSALNVTQY